MNRDCVEDFLNGDGVVDVDHRIASACRLPPIQICLWHHDVGGHLLLSGDGYYLLLGSDGYHLLLGSDGYWLDG